MFLVLKGFFSKIGINWAIAYTLFARVLQGVGGVGTVILVVKFLTKNEQGYYYTFGSLLGIQVFFELGLTAIITQFVAHEIAHLQWKDNVTIIGDIQVQSRLSSLLHFCIKWFLILSVFFFIALFLAGNYFFSKFHPDLNISWQIPWIILSIITCCFLIFDPLQAFLEGLGKVKEVAKMRLAQQTTYLLFVITFLFSGFKLYSSALASVFGFICAFLIVFFSDNKDILVNIYKIKGLAKINYQKEIFPYQWKIALSWISSYFIFQLFNPIVFARDGPVAAGQMGLTLALLGGITSLSMTWISTKIPIFSMHISKKEYFELDKIFFKSLKQSLLINGLCLFIFFSGAGIMQYLNLPLGKRIVPLLPLILLGITTFINQLVFSYATYLRCHKTEPLLVYSIILGIICCLSIFIFGKLYGLMGICLSYCLITLLISFPWIYNIFNKKRKVWH